MRIGRFHWVMAAGMAIGCASARASPSRGLVMTSPEVDPIRGTTIRWVFADGPMAGIAFEHTFSEDGTVTWVALDGPMKGRSGAEQEYAAIRVSDGVYAISYLATSGYTLTVVLNFVTMQMNGFASNETEWYAMTGAFEIP